MLRTSFCCAVPLTACRDCDIAFRGCPLIVARVVLYPIVSYPIVAINRIPAAKAAVPLVVRLVDMLPTLFPILTILAAAPAMAVVAADSRSSHCPQCHLRALRGFSLCLELRNPTAWATEPSLPSAKTDSGRL